MSDIQGVTCTLGTSALADRIGGCNIRMPPAEPSTSPLGES
jgi:hypothetical protein